MNNHFIWIYLMIFLFCNLNIIFFSMLLWRTFNMNKIWRFKYSLSFSLIFYYADIFLDGSRDEAQQRLNSRFPLKVTIVLFFENLLDAIHKVRAFTLRPPMCEILKKCKIGCIYLHGDSYMDGASISEHIKLKWNIW